MLGSALPKEFMATQVELSLLLQSTVVGRQADSHPRTLLPSTLSHSLLRGCGMVRLGTPATAAAAAAAAAIACTEICTTQVTQKERQEQLWQLFFSDPFDWWDNRADKSSSRHPDFKHRTSKEPLWLNSPHKPAWVDSQLARWDVQMRGPRALSTQIACDSVGGDQISVIQSLRKRCEEEAELSEAVEALDSMVQRGYQVSDDVFYRMLKRCMADKDLVCGRRVHSLVVTSGYGASAFLATHIIGMYASHGELEDAAQVFTEVPKPNLFMWSSIILAHARQGQPKYAIKFYQQMRASGVEPNNHIFAAALKACASAQDLVSGKEVHNDIQTSAVKADVFLGNSLVTMYAKCGSLSDARKVFDSLPTRDVVTWTAMIAGYTQQGLGQEALALYARMQHEGITPADHVTFLCLLQACASVGALQQGKHLHSQIRERGLECDVFIGSSLVDMYSKCGKMDDARKVFDGLPIRNLVTWNAMIAGYSQQGLGREALAIFASMQHECITPADRITFACLLQACASVGALLQGTQIHGQIRARGLEGDVFIGTSLVDMYSKCGSLETARQVFDRLPTKVVATWNALLIGCAEHSDGHMAMQCFEEMLEQGLQPDENTFTCLLVACSHAGLVQEGMKYFKMMVEDYGIVPTDYHNSCMIDILARAGQLDDAENMLLTTSLVNEVVGWTSLLSACKIYGEIERGQRCFDHLLALQADDASAYVLLGNIYANAGKWDEVERIESLRKSVGAMKKPAKACIEVKDEVHEFTVGEDRSDISSKLRSVNSRLKEEGGHVPQTQLVLRAVSEQEKEDALCGHAEKLALAYGLLNTPDGATLLVTKNLRMCNDCHSSTKIMSCLENREIIVRDTHRVHRFLNGSCSCGDRN